MASANRDFRKASDYLPSARYLAVCDWRDCYIRQHQPRIHSVSGRIGALGMWTPVGNDGLWESISGPSGKTAFVQLADSGIITASQSNFEVTGLPSNTYSHLVLILCLRSDRAANTFDEIRLRINGDSAANYYAMTALFGHSGALGTIETVGGTSAYVGRATAASSPTGWFSVMQVTFGRFGVGTPAYNHFSVYGYAPRDSSTGLLQPFVGGGMYNAPSNMATITIFPDAGSNWIAGSSAALYGVGLL